MSPAVRSHRHYASAARPLGLGAAAALVTYAVGVLIGVRI